jgi:hypothetical protein
MEHPTEVRRQQAQVWFDAWLAIKSEPSRSDAIIDEDREVLVVSTLLELRAEEIVLALNDDPVACVYCKSSMIVDHEHNKAGWVGDARVLRAGVRRARSKELTIEGADVVTLLRTGVADELAERRDQRIERWRSQEPGMDATEGLRQIIPFRADLATGKVDSFAQ